LNFDALTLLVMQTPGTLIATGRQPVTRIRIEVTNIRNPGSTPAPLLPAPAPEAPASPDAPKVPLAPAAAEPTSPLTTRSRTPTQRPNGVQTGFLAIRPEGLSLHPDWFGNSSDPASSDETDIKNLVKKHRRRAGVPPALSDGVTQRVGAGNSSYSGAADRGLTSAATELVSTVPVRLEQARQLMGPHA
jgi:hypothetical protein